MADINYQPISYSATCRFILEPNQDIIILLRQCGNYWFRSGVVHEVIFDENTFKFGNNVPSQLAIWVRNYSEFGRVNVEEGSTLQHLLNLPEIIYKIVSITLEDLNIAQTYFQTIVPLNNGNNIATEDDEEEEEEEEDESIASEITSKLGGRGGGGGGCEREVGAEKGGKKIKKKGKKGKKGACKMEEDEEEEEESDVEEEVDEEEEEEEEDDDMFDQTYDIYVV